MPDTKILQQTPESEAKRTALRRQQQKRAKAARHVTRQKGRTKRPATR